ncbi:MAG: hypothetical protein QOC99_1352 [Acidobacteriota bacterium]|jgi:hypothetical protein|nr:hypothetical protein [Acidobacteriota bacterium]
MNEANGEIQAGTIARAEQELDAHLISLRRKLEKAVLRGEPVEHIQARICHEEDLLRRMRAYNPRGLDTGSLE